MYLLSLLGSYIRTIRIINTSKYIYRDRNFTSWSLKPDVHWPKFNKQKVGSVDTEIYRLFDDWLS